MQIKPVSVLQNISLSATMIRFNYDKI